MAWGWNRGKERRRGQRGRKEEEDKERRAERGKIMSVM